MELVNSTTIINVPTSRRVIPCRVRRCELFYFIPRGLLQITGLTQKQLLVGSLYASDGSCNHAVTVVNGLVFDSNERSVRRIIIQLMSMSSETMTSWMESRRGPRSSNMFQDSLRRMDESKSIRLTILEKRISRG